MRYFNQIRGLDETCEGPRGEYILPRTKAGKKLVRLFLRGSWTEFPEDHADIKDCRRSRRPGARLDGFDFFACAVRQQEGIEPWFHVRMSDFLSRAGSASNAAQNAVGFPWARRASRNSARALIQSRSSRSHRMTGICP